MKKCVVLLVILCGFSQLMAQAVFTSQATGGNWNLGTTWDQTGCASGCVAGVDFPGPNDVAIVAVAGGASVISFPRSGSPSFACKDLYIVNDVASSLRATGLTGTVTLTINGQMSGALNDLSGVAEPTVNVFQTTMSNVNIIFTGNNLDDPSGAVITSWGYNSPIYRTTFNPGVGNTVRVDNYSVRNSSTIQTGTLQINSGQIIRDFTGSAQFVVNASSTLNVLGEINGDGTTTSRFSTVTINGTLTTGNAGYVNSTTFTLGSTGVLNIGFNGVNQTQGWWHQSAAPTTSSIDAASTVSYQSNTAQNIFAATYGNLSLSSTIGVTKTLSGSGLAVQGNLTIGANVTFSPTSQVDFTGTAAQSITGTGTLNLIGGIEVNKSSGTLTLNKAVTTGSIVITAGTLNLGDVTTSLNGTLVSNSGTITSGTAGSLLVTGPTVFSGSGSTTLNNLTVSSGTVGYNNSVSLTGNLANSGSLVFSSTSTLTFSGGNSQAISGSAFTVGNMVINKPSATLSNNGTMELTGVLTVTTGTFDADGSGSGILTLNSDTNGDAAIGPMAGGSITGEVTFERYFDNTSNRWRNLAFPVTSVTYAELGSSITLAANSLGTYTESTLGDVDQGWTIVSGGTLNSALGHSAWMYDIQPITISVRGPLLRGTPAQSGSPYNFGVTYTDDPTQAATQDGWNFIPNPFASPIDWNNAGWVKTNVNAAAAVWDVESNIYRYTNVDWDGVVAQGQAIWVQTNAASPVLTCTESAKEVISDPVFYRVAAENSRLMISLKSGTNVDKAVIQFKDGSTPEFDGEFDSYKLKNAIYNLSSLTNDGVSLAANVLPKSFCTSIVKLNLTNIEPGMYTYSFEGLESFRNLNKVLLVDQLTGESQTIEAGSAYSFEVTSDPKSYGSERFQIKFDFSDQKGSPVVERASAQLISNSEEGNQWYLNDEPILGATNQNFTPTIRGTYFVRVQNSGCELQSENIAINEAFTRVFPNPTSSVVKVDVQNLLHDGSYGDILIYSAQGLLMKNEKFSAQDKIKEMDIVGMKPGVYTVTLVSSKGLVLDKQKIVIK